jgi:hypothetical protein
MRLSLPFCSLRSPRLSPRSVTTLLLCLLAAGPAQAQSRDTTLRLASDAVVDVTVRSGRLVVRGVDGTTGTVRAATNDYQLRSTGVTLTLAARDGDRRGDGRAVELDLPRGVRLVVSTISGDVDVRDINGGIDVRSTSGDVQLTQVGGRIIVETISGDVSITGGNQLRVNTVSGTMRLRESGGDISLHTTSGDMSVSGSGITRFEAESMSGDVQLDGQLEATARVQVNTHSGDVTLRLPDNARGRLELSSVSGDLSPGGPLTLLPGELSGRGRGRSTRRYEFGPGSTESGSRGLQIDVRTFNGDVRLVRAPRS